MEIDGDEWEAQGIYNGDVVIIDRALTPRKTDYIVWWDESTFIISRLNQMPAGNTVWGTVSSVVHRLRP